jgi:hypothetical protein
LPPGREEVGLAAGRWVEPRGRIVTVDSGERDTQGFDDRHTEHDIRAAWGGEGNREDAR